MTIQSGQYLEQVISSRGFFAPLLCNHLWHYVLEDSYVGTCINNERLHETPTPCRSTRCVRKRFAVDRDLRLFLTGALYMQNR